MCVHRSPIDSNSALVYVGTLTNVAPVRWSLYASLGLTELTLEVARYPTMLRGPHQTMLIGQPQMEAFIAREISTNGILTLFQCFVF